MNKNIVITLSDRKLAPFDQAEFDAAEARGEVAHLV